MTVWPGRLATCEAGSIVVVYRTESRIFYPWRVRYGASRAILWDKSWKHEHDKLSKCRISWLFIKHWVIWLTGAGSSSNFEQTELLQT